MQSLKRDGYTRDQVLDALHASSRTWDFAYELLDRYNAHRGWLDQVLEGTVKHSVIEQVRRSAFFRMRDTDKIDWSSDRIRPWVRLRMPDGGQVSWPQGVFLLTSPTRSITAAGVAMRDVSGLDQTVVLRDHASADRYSVLAGANVGLAVRALLVGAGIPDVNIEPTILGAARSRDWDPGTSRLDIVNDLLASINYEPIAFNSAGVAIGRSYALPEQRASEYTYADDQDSVVRMSMVQNFDLENVPNQWTLVVSDPDRVLTSQWTNDNPLSPSSITSRGRVIARFDDTVDAANQATLDALTQRRAYEDSQTPLEVEFSTGLMPFHDNEDVFTLDLSRLGPAGKFRETMWELPLVAGRGMEHRAEKILSLDPTNVLAP